MYGTHNVYLSFVEKNMARGTPSRADPISYIHHQVSKIHHLPLPPHPFITTIPPSIADRYFATDPRTHIGISTQIFIFMYIYLFIYIILCTLYIIRFSCILPSVHYSVVANRAINHHIVRMLFYIIQCSVRVCVTCIPINLRRKKNKNQRLAQLE